jgi:hypothetical protein
MKKQDSTRGGGKIVKDNGLKGIYFVSWEKFKDYKNQT